MKHSTDILVKIRVNGRNKSEEDWAMKIGLNAYHKYCTIFNQFVIPVYNKVWHFLYPNTKNWDEEHPNYMGLYESISKNVIRRIVKHLGGHRRDLEVVVNPLFNMIPASDFDGYIVNDMIQIIYK